MRQHEFGLDKSNKERDGLWMFYKTAHELYQSEVVGDGKLYNRYVSDFLNSHTYTDRVDAAGMNEHKKNFHIMEELLTVRQDLVQRYFAKKNLCYSDYLVMHHEFNTTQQSPNSEKSTALGSFLAISASNPDFQCCFNSVQISLITNIANQVHLFSSDVLEAEVKALFACCLEHPLKSACNRRIAFFFDALCKYKLISTRWQHIIDKNGLILSSAKNILLNSSKLSTALNEAKQNDGCVYRTIELRVQEISANREFKK
ncbi:hypothetical protein [Bacteroides sp. 519]|uniref:hypothetical protein n=1 Tax=Bacteroides sp. 519 TaxID=2302937 RepID=UPI0013D3FA0F|nr:hypothetical protein [Bacteroides sp. 519]